MRGLVQDLEFFYENLSFYQAVGSDSTNFDGKVEDICVAIEQIVARR